MSTLKQKRAVRAIVENGGNVSKAMREVGYTNETAKTPSKLTDSDGYHEEAAFFLKELENEKNETIKMLKKTRKDGKYNEHSQHLDRTVKLIQLLEGKPTGILGGVDEIFKTLSGKSEGIPKEDT